MDTSKINGIVTVKNGELDLSALVNDGKEIKTDIDKLITMKEIMDKTLFNYEKEIQKDFKNNIGDYILPKE